MAYCQPLSAHGDIERDDTVRAHSALSTVLVCAVKVYIEIEIGMHYVVYVADGDEDSVRNFGWKRYVCRIIYIATLAIINAEFIILLSRFFKNSKRRVSSAPRQFSSRARAVYRLHPSASSHSLGEEEEEKKIESARARKKEKRKTVRGDDGVCRSVAILSA